MEVELTKISTFFVGVVGLILLPMGFIWAFNSLFLTNIEYTFMNWLAVAFLQLYFQVIVKASTVNTRSHK